MLIKLIELSNEDKRNLIFFNHKLFMIFFSETMYSVIDYAKRNMIRIQETTSKATNAFLLVFLENFENKTKELSVRADNE